MWEKTKKKKSADASSTFLATQTSTENKADFVEKNGENTSKLILTSKYNRRQTKLTNSKYLAAP